MAKHFLYLTNDKLVALMWKAGAIVERDVFGATELVQGVLEQMAIDQIMPIVGTELQAIEQANV